MAGRPDGASRFAFGGRPCYEQKRVDILLGVDMVQLAAKPTYLIRSALQEVGLRWRGLPFI